MKRFMNQNEIFHNTCVLELGIINHFAITIPVCAASHVIIQQSFCVVYVRIVAADAYQFPNLWILLHIAFCLWN